MLYFRFKNIFININMSTIETIRNFFNYCYENISSSFSNYANDLESAGESITNSPKVIFIKNQIVDMVYNPSKIKHIISGWLTNKISKYFVEIEKNSYIVHYPYGVRWYKIKIPKISGPTSLVTRIIGDYNDITSIITPLLGPSNNFHNQPVSPESLGYKKMIFEFALEPDKIFENDETIVL